MTETIEIVAAGDAGDLICNLKAAVTALECQQKMEMANQKLRRKAKKPPPPPMYMMIPLEHKNEEGTACEEKMKRARGHRHDRDSSSDYEDSISNSESRRTSHRRRSACEENNGPTMRGGVLHTRCGCVHRDGLQDSCPLTECRGHPDCLTKPWAVCRPARYFQARFPDNYPSASHHDAIMF